MHFAQLFNFRQEFGSKPGTIPPYLSWGLDTPLSCSILGRKKFQGVLSRLRGEVDGDSFLRRVHSGIDAYLKLEDNGL